MMGDVGADEPGEVAAKVRGVQQVCYPSTGKDTKDKGNYVSTATEMTTVFASRYDRGVSKMVHSRTRPSRFMTLLNRASYQTSVSYYRETDWILYASSTRSHEKQPDYDQNVAA